MWREVRSKKEKRKGIREKEGKKRGEEMEKE